MFVLLLWSNIPVTLNDQNENKNSESKIFFITSNGQVQRTLLSEGLVE